MSSCRKQPCHQLCATPLLASVRSLELVGVPYSAHPVPEECTKTGSSSLLVDTLADVNDSAVLGMLSYGVQSSVDGGEVIFPRLRDGDLLALPLWLWKLHKHSCTGSRLRPMILMAIWLGYIGVSIR